MTTAGNAKHQAAVAATSELVAQLRVQVRAELDVLLALAGPLGDLLDTRQSVGLGFMTPEGKERANEQARLDRQAARGVAHRAAGVGRAWLNGTETTRGTGQVPAPVTVTAASAAAQILFGLQQHVRRLVKAGALLPTLEAEQTEAEELGLCTWPRRQLTATPPTTDGTISDLVAHLGRLVDVYASRPGLQAMLRDLDHLEQVAREVVDGPARTNHPDVCPWCGHASLVIHHRADGRDAAFIRCEGRHACTCDDPWCTCRHHPGRNRHEWIQSGRAAHTWRDLARQQKHRKELIILETKAHDAVQRTLALHAPTPTYRDVDDCPSPAEHAPSWSDAEGAARICTACPPLDSVCDHCRTERGEYVVHPCPTAQALDLDPLPAENSADTTAANAPGDPAAPTNTQE
ncbi:hypothetical protein ABFU82_22470 [Nocardioides sp. WV_118_6]